MKKFLLFLFLLPAVLQTKDLIVLQNGHSFEGSVCKVQKSHVLFVQDGRRFRIPAKELAFVGLEDPTRLDDVDICLRAYRDVRLRGRQWHNFFGGVFFGPITVIYDLLKDYHPLRDERVLLLSKNKGSFSDPVYVECYTYQARTRATIQAAGGWATWIILFSKR